MSSKKKQTSSESGLQLVKDADLRPTNVRELQRAPDSLPPGEDSINVDPSTLTTIIAILLATRQRAYSNLEQIILGEENSVDEETQNANDYFKEYLRENVEAAKIIAEMQEIINEFQERMPRILKSKCIDGRVHGSKAIGRPQTTVLFCRTDGGNLDTSCDNTVFWGRVAMVVQDAKVNTPGTPAIFFALGHHATEGYGGGCAAHNGDYNKALQAAKDQVDAVRKEYKSSNDIYCIYGMQNTTDMSESLIFEDGSQIDNAQLLDELELNDPIDLFQDNFLDTKITDVATNRYVNGLTPRQQLTGGASVPMYSNLQTTLAMEAYLSRELCSIQGAGSTRNFILKPKIFELLQGKLNAVEGLPDSLKGSLLYQMVWNMAYTLHQRNRLAQMTTDESTLYLEHAEDLVCYGEGFELLPRNKAILAKTGRGKDKEALEVAKNVLMKNRKKRSDSGKAQDHLPLVHINVEVTGGINNWDTLNVLVQAPLSARLKIVREVFGDDVRVLTTYSHQHEKQFYPIKIQPEILDATGTVSKGDPRECFPMSTVRGLKRKNTTKDELERRQMAYRDLMLKAAA
ncbi:hypothetical protein HZA38_03610 [Candidatus Peregrinibacteria bacterium]|nr:hypothetical protein [Candidatus Peregrinibacteria bacterium]